MTQLYALPEYGIISIKGDDRISYLQGQLTCNMSQLAEKGWLAGCHCDAKGKLWSTFILAETPEELFLIMRRSILAGALAALTKFSVFAKVTINDASDRLLVYGLLSPSTHLPDDALQVEFCGSRRFVLSPAPLAAQSDNSAWFLTQIQSAWPELEAASMAGEYVPQMLNQADIGAINFKKGCYIGQETVARMQYLGKQKRATFYLSGEADKVMAGTELEVERNGNWRSSGQVINAIQQNGTYHVLAILPTDADASEHYRISGEPASQLRLQALPYSLHCLKTE